MFKQLFCLFDNRVWTVVSIITYNSARRHQIVQKISSIEKDSKIFISIKIFESSNLMTQNDKVSYNSKNTMKS